MRIQHNYYLEKTKSEERVRSLYHDMKNHLLVLEGQSTDAAKQMARELRAQIADYEDYVHTGSPLLDIILRDKAEKARENHVAFSAAVDFGGMDFIEPLDISTLFGNGIDNALEASEKLSEECRVILVKAGRVQNFFSLLIENNCLQENQDSTGRSAGSARAERNPPTSFRFSPVLPQAANPCVTASAGLLTCSSFCAFPAAGPVADCRTSDARRAPELTATGIVADSHCVPF